MSDLEQRFWEKVDVGEEDECWLWMAGSRGNGYGAFRFRDKNHYAHRVVIYLQEGHLPSEDKTVCHICDTPACVNPNHLFVATQAENAFDAKIKGRLSGPTELSNPQGKLTDEDVCKIRRLFINTDITREKLSDRYGVGKSYIYALLTHKRRGGIEGSPPPINLSDFEERNGNFNLTKQDVREIRHRYENSDGLSYTDLARDYPVTKSSIAKIVRREQWSDID